MDSQKGERVAAIDEVGLKITPTGGSEASVDVKYVIEFDSYDQNSNQTYVEVCKLVGDDTHAGDPASEAPDDTLGYLTPLFFRDTRSDGRASLERQFTKSFHQRDLDEDRGLVPNPDEIRAVVTLTPVAPSVVTTESNMVTLNPEAAHRRASLAQPTVHLRRPGSSAPKQARCARLLWRPTRRSRRGCRRGPGRPPR
ncbi:hypothetical protein BH18ACT4_BH18ACT4_12410 [soil metagenome]